MAVFSMECRLDYGEWAIDVAVSNNEAVIVLMEQVKKKNLFASAVLLCRMGRWVLCAKE